MKVIDFDLEKFKNDTLKCYIKNQLIKYSDTLSNDKKQIFIRNKDSNDFNKVIDTVINKINKSSNSAIDNNIRYGSYIEEYVNLEGNLFKVFIDVNYCGTKIHYVFCSLFYITDFSRKTA